VGARLALLLVAALTAAPGAAAAQVDPHGYQAFFVWPGTAPPADVQPRLIYLLAAQVRHGGAARLMPMRVAPPRLGAVPVWLVVRTERLDWGADIVPRLIAELNRWQAAGNRVAGLQIDFDVPTHGLGRYRAFLADLRARLPQRWRLSITGLMDWSANGDPREVAALAGVIDEAVIQTYQGRHTIPGYAAYFRRMGPFPLRFRVALVEGGQWQTPPELAHQPGFAGYVVFLLAQVDRHHAGLGS